MSAFSSRGAMPSAEASVVQPIKSQGNSPGNAGAEPGELENGTLLLAARPLLGKAPLEGHSVVPADWSVPVPPAPAVSVKVGPSKGAAHPANAGIRSPPLRLSRSELAPILGLGCANRS